VKKNINKSSKIYIAGHTGLVGSAILSRLKHQRYKNLITVKKDKLNLLDQKSVLNFFKKK
jgi:GDP-L-fucose synthase